MNREAAATRKTIRQQVRNLALAALAASTVFADPAMQAHAESKDAPPADDGTRCSIQTGPGEFDFYMPGDTIEVPITDMENPFGATHEFACGVTGNWVDMGMRVRPPSRGPRGFATGAALGGRQLQANSVTATPTPVSTHGSQAAGKSAVRLSR